MENLILIGVGILVVFLILRFIFKAIKTALYVTLLLVVAALGLHFFSPQTIDNLIGKERHDKITKVVTEKAEVAKDTVSEKAKQGLDKVMN